MEIIKLFIMKYIFLTITALLCNYSLYSQSDEEKISVIRDIFYSTEKSVENCKKNTFDFTGYSSQGGDLDVYAIENMTCKAVITYYGEMGKKSKEFYFRNDSLFFVFEVIYNYNQPASLGDVIIESKEENRYYIWNKSIVKFIDTEKNEYWNKSIPNYSDISEVIFYEAKNILFKK